jgi:hypothetical protein
MDDEGRPKIFAYRQAPDGLWIEFVHRSYEDNLREWITDTLAE